MSLLNLLQSEDPAVQNGLLNFGLSLLRSKGNFGNAVGQAGVAGQLGARDYRQQQALLKRTALGDQLMQAQVAEEEMKVKAREAAAEQAKQRDAYLQSLQPVQGINANAATGITGPTPAAASAIGQRPPIDPLMAYRMLGPEGAKQLFEAQNWGRNKVARTAESVDAQGNKIVRQLDEYGQEVGSGIPGYVAPQLIDQGNKKIFAVPKAGASFDIGMSPESRDASARGWAGVNLQRERLALDKGASLADAGGPGQAALVQAFGKPPKDYRWKPDGSSEPIPGGPADIKAGEIGAKAEKGRQAAVAQTKSVISEIADAKKLVGYDTVGVGGLLKDLPMSKARDLNNKLTTIKANLGFDRLQQMREASPTGGALGAIAVQELIALQSTVASLDQMQSVPQMNAALAKIERHYKRWQETLGGSTGGATGSFGDRSIKRTGTQNGRKVVEYTDGSIEYAD